MYAKLSSYSKYFLGGRINRVRVLLRGGDGGAGAASSRLPAATTRQRFFRFFAALCEAFRLLFLVYREIFVKLQRRVVAF